MFWSFSHSQILGQEQLIDIEEICSTHFAFAALRADGQVVSWGYNHYGGLCDVADCFIMLYYVLLCWIMLYYVFIMLYYYVL
jgi:hypothetical protein